MRWSDFCAAQRERAPRLIQAANALIAGDLTLADPALAALLPHPDPVFRSSLLGQLRASPPQPRPTLVRGLLWGDVIDRDTPPEDADEFLLRAWAAERGAPGPVSPEERLAWALDALRFLGEECSRRERAAWTQDLPPNPAQGADEAQTTWLCWFQGGSGPLQGAARWLARHGEAIERPFRLVAARHAHEGAPRGSALRAAVRDAFLTQMTVGQDGVPGWLDVAVRVLESASAGGALQALAARLDDQSRPRAARCLARRRSLAGTATWLWPALAPSWRSELLDHRLVDPAYLESFAGAHAGRHLVSAWARGRATHPDAAWAVARACRRRHRLRAAVASGDLRAMEAAILALDHLDLRTGKALARYALDWAWDEAHHDFAFGGRALTPTCGEAPTRPTPPRGARLKPARRHDPRQVALRTWVLKVVLRGAVSELHAWTRHEGGRASALLQGLLNELPERCRSRRGGSWDAVRAALWMDLDAHLDALRPTLVALAAVDLSLSKPVLRARVRAILDQPGLWHPSIPAICKGFPRCVTFARALLGAPAPVEGA